MAIRTRISKPPPVGFPDCRFVQYRMRFGVVNAEFMSPGMRLLMGEYILPGNLKAHLRRAIPEIRYYDRHQLERYIAKRTAMNTVTDELLSVIEYFPTIGDLAMLLADDT